MDTSFAISNDGKKIAYDVSGDGQPVILLHGGRQTRKKWHELGYVECLKSDYKVVTLDIRGNGESDKPLAASDYNIDRLCEDILAVADASGVENFMLWGYSYGGNIGRYLAARSSRVSKFVLIGVPFGLGASGNFRQFIVSFCEHWRPILESQSVGTLDIQALSSGDNAALASGMMPLALAWTSSMLEWPVNEPKDLRCPTLWVVGSENEAAMASFNHYRAALESSKVTAQIIDGFNHEQELLEINSLVPLINAYIK